MLILSVGQNVANAARSHLVWSTMAMTSRAAATIERLIWASSSVASASPDSGVKPAAPRNAFWTLIRLNRPSPSWPTTDSASQRTRPPSIRTTIPGCPASSEAIRRPLVMTVSWLQPARALSWRATDRAVVLASITMLSPSCTSAAPAAPIHSFSSAWSRSRMSNESSGWRRSSAIAPPWVRTSRRSCSSPTRSLRIVTAETWNRAARSLTRARPCSSTMRAMCSWRSRANTSPGEALAGSVTPLLSSGSGARAGFRLVSAGG